MGSLHFFVDFVQELEALGNTPRAWGGALGVTLGAGIVLLVIKGLTIKHVSGLAQKRPSDWFDGLLDLLRHTGNWFLLVLSLYFGSLSLVLPERVRAIVNSIVIVALLLQAAFWADTMLRSYLLRQAKRRVVTDAGSATTLMALGFLARLILWLIALLLVLANLGIDVTAMVAGLGIGGIAIALAAQNILGDLFASASIVLDKPFVLGDFIVVGEDMGKVEYIGLKTTRLRSLSGEQLIFANNDLLKSRIRNFKRMSERRMVFSIGVTYQVSAEKLAAIPVMLREIVEAQSLVRFDRAHFKQYGDSALIFEVVYFVLSPEVVQAMDIQQSINLAVFQRFGEEQIEFAYPTRTVHVRKQDLS